MIRFHCIYCGEQSEPQPWTDDPEQKAKLRAFIAKHEACGEKAVGAMVEMGED